MLAINKTRPALTLAAEAPELLAAGSRARAEPPDPARLFQPSHNLSLLEKLIVLIYHHPQNPARQNAPHHYIPTTNFQPTKTMPPVFNSEMNVAKWRRRFIHTLRIYPFVVLALLGLTYLLGGFSSKADAPISQQVMIIASYFFIGVAPILAIIGFIIIGQAGDAEYKNNTTNQTKFNYGDAFEIPSEEMHGYKLALITGRTPTFTGLTGDTYAADASATCALNTEHTPPVINCECGFYAYRDFNDAKFEHSINPGSFLLDVDLYGIGFVYQRGFRAETQLVNHLSIPKRCMKCKLLPAKLFVASFKLSRSDDTWWQWQVRCLICSNSFKARDKLSFDQMAKELGVLVD